MDTPNKTFPTGLTHLPACDKITANVRWFSCPTCGKRLMKALPDTVAENLPLFCWKCKTEHTVNIPPLPEP